MRFAEADAKYGLTGVQGWMRADALAWIYDQCYRLPEAAIVLEIGCWLGRTTCTMLAALVESGNDGRVICVDAFDGRATSRAETDEAAQALTTFQGNIKARALPMPRILIGNTQSGEIAKQVPDASVGLLFIDADHGPGVATDLDLWEPKLVGGGLVCGHDITYPVVEAAVKAKFGRYERGPSTIWYCPWKGRGDSKSLAYNMRDGHAFPKRTICEVLREIWDAVEDDNAPEQRRRVHSLLSDAYVMAKKMDRRLREYKHGWDEDFWEVNADMESDISRRKARHAHPR